MQDFYDLIARRESCRDFAAAPPEDEKLLRCLEAARLAPSACNSQPYAFVVVRESTLVKKTADAVRGGGMNRFAGDCPCFVVIVEEKANLSARFGAKLKDQDYTSVDIGIAALQMCLAAAEEGLSTCMLGWFDERRLKEALSIDAQKRVRLVVCVGYAKTDAIRAKTRKDISDLVTFR